MTVFANGLEVACKAQANKVVAAFPDVCFTPPENPATPPGVPVPYPSFGFDSDTDKGTSTVKIGGKTITQKNKSYYTRTTGTEAGCAAKKGVITSKNTGKEYAVAWSNNVKADGEPVNRMTDLSTNNHASPQGNAPPWPKIGRLTVGGQNCLELLAEINIYVHPYEEAEENCGKYEESGKQSDHVLQDACFRGVGRGAQTLDAFPNYDEKQAPCICLRDSNTRTQHAKKSRKQRVRATELRREAGAGKSRPCTQSFKAVRDADLQRTAESLPKLANDPNAMKCLKRIVDTYFKHAAGVETVKELDKVQCNVPAI